MENGLAEIKTEENQLVPSSVPAGDLCEQGGLETTEPDERLVDHSQENVSSSCRNGRAPERHQMKHPSKRKDETTLIRGHTKAVGSARIDTGERKDSCPECGKSFCHKSALITHLRIHTEEKLYQCQECGKSFNRNLVLIQHQRIHTGEKPFACLSCGKKFSQSSALTQHRRIHTGERAYNALTVGKTSFTSHP